MNLSISISTKKFFTPPVFAAVKKALLYRRTSTKTTEPQQFVKVFPNPSNGVYTLQIDRFVGKVNVEVSDANGRIILNQAELSATNSVDISTFQSGIYLLKVSGDGINFTEKLIKN